jgi:hypothetical protein
VTREQQKAERLAIWEGLRPAMQSLSLLNLVGIDLGIRLAAGGLRSVWDLDQWVMGWPRRTVATCSGSSTTGAREPTWRN